ncbi:hypothetical protein TR51_17080 [Kitasatospora griseola]|uniref:ATP-dependent DNA ligase family profile domain-containing protein n=1 Tax=Kitasatospora griseola TaxID=2064 RepID=A0A0D0NBD0_KITGR|nr:hypothetical protein TR51_17080 [Kitasatospora griseola]
MPPGGRTSRRVAHGSPYWPGARCRCGDPQDRLHDQRDRGRERAQPQRPGASRTRPPGTRPYAARTASDVRLVEPEVVLEVVADTASDHAGRWHHPVRAHRIRTDLTLGDLPTA